MRDSENFAKPPSSRRRVFRSSHFLCKPSFHPLVAHNSSIFGKLDRFDLKRLIRRGLGTTSRILYIYVSMNRSVGTRMHRYDPFALGPITSACALFMRATHPAADCSHARSGIAAIHA